MFESSFGWIARHGIFAGSIGLSNCEQAIGCAQEIGQALLRLLPAHGHALMAAVSAPTTLSLFVQDNFPNGVDYISNFNDI